MSLSDSGHQGQGWISSLPRILDWAGAILLFAMMLLTFVDVIGRYVFNSPIVGGFEITEFMLATLIFVGIPLITLRGGHITVDLLDPVFPPSFRSVRDRLVSVLWAVVLVFVAYQLWIKASDLVEQGEITQVLRFPIAPFAFAMAILVLVSAAIATIAAVRGGSPEPQDRENTGAGST